MNTKQLIIAGAAAAGALWYVLKGRKTTTTTASTGAAAVAPTVGTSASQTYDLGALIAGALQASGGTMGQQTATTNVQTKPIAAPGASAPVAQNPAFATGGGGSQTAATASPFATGGGSPATAADPGRNTAEQNAAIARAKAPGGLLSAW